MRKIYGELYGITDNKIICDYSNYRKELISQGRNEEAYEILKSMADLVKLQIPELKNKVINFLPIKDDRVASFVFDISREDLIDYTCQTEYTDQNELGFNLFIMAKN